MYEERKDNFSLKGFILQLLLIIVFVFIMLLLFPTKNYINERTESLQSEEQLARLEVLYGEIFANNVERMKDAAIGYFTDERLPQTIGQSITITLGEMYEKHLVLKMQDVDGNACSTTESYVKVTKYDNEYRFKVNLKCGDKEDYIIVYMGCYTYCTSGMCEKRDVIPTKTPDNVPTKTPDKTPDNPTPTPDNPTPSPKYMYKYKLETPGTTSCSGWSDWTTDKLVSSDKVEVQTKVENQKVGVSTSIYISGYTTKKVKFGTKQVQTGVKYQLVEENVTEKYISGYTTKKVITGTKDVIVDYTTKKVSKKVQAGTTEVYIGSDSGTTKPSNTSTRTYIKTGSTTKQACTTCAVVTYYTWDIYEVVPVYKIVTTEEKVPVYEKEYIYEEQQVPIWSTREVKVNKLKEIPIYETVDNYIEKKTPIFDRKSTDNYRNVMYYRSRACTYINGGVYYKWSTSDNDSYLIGLGYVYTGEQKEIK